MARRLLRALVSYPSRSPLTFGYVCLLLLTRVWVAYVLPADRSADILGYASTNVTNLADHPLGALLGSACFLAGTLTGVGRLGFASTVLTFGVGVCWLLARAERRWGARRAFAVFLGGHVGATLLTAGVILLALGQGWYGEEVRGSLDYGISYGAQTVLAVSTAALPRRARPWWVLLLLAWPFGGAEWASGPLPDFTAVGHVLAALLGFALLAARPETRFGRTAAV